MGEEDDLPDGVLTGEDHDKSVDADADAGAGGHAVFDGAEEVFVYNHGLFITALPEFGLRFEPFALDDGVVEFGEGVADLFAADDQLKALNNAGL